MTFCLAQDVIQLIIKELGVGTAVAGCAGLIGMGVVGWVGGGRGMRAEMGTYPLKDKC